ncbi:hypothetical protein NKJ32_35020, partial [Mesorhizobium sp. M0159]
KDHEALQGGTPASAVRFHHDPIVNLFHFPRNTLSSVNIETCVTPPCKSGTKSRVSPQRDSCPGQLSLHQSADNFTAPTGHDAKRKLLLILQQHQRPSECEIRRPAARLQRGR